MEPKKETAVESIMQGLANKFLESINANKNVTRIELGNILKEKFNLDDIVTSMNRQARRNRIIIALEQNKLEFKYMAIMLADSHPLLKGWLGEYKITEVNKMLSMRIFDFESGKADSEIKTKEAIVPYREFQDNLRGLIPPPAEITKRQIGAIDVGRK